MQRTSPLYQAVLENDPISFIKILFKSHAEWVTIDDKETKLTLLQETAKNERADVIPHIFLAKADYDIDGATAIPNEDCVDSDSKDYRPLRSEEKLPLIHAAE